MGISTRSIAAIRDRDGPLRNEEGTFVVNLRRPHHAFASSFRIVHGGFSCRAAIAGLQNSRCVFPGLPIPRFRAASAEGIRLARAAATGLQHPPRDARGFRDRLGRRPWRDRRCARLRAISMLAQSHRRLSPFRAGFFSQACIQNSNSLNSPTRYRILAVLARSD